MKIFALMAAMLAATAIPATAQVSDLCRSHYTVAEAIMQARQRGGDMMKVLDAFAEASETDRKLYEAMTRMAWADYPRMNVPSNQDDMVADFASTILLVCLEAS